MPRTFFSRSFGNNTGGGALSPLGSLTIAVVDNLDGTVTATIAGFTSGDNLEWYVSKLDQNFVAGAWTLYGIAGTISPPPTTIGPSGLGALYGYGPYFSLARNATTGSLSLPYWHTCRDPSALLPVVERIALALVARLETVTTANGYTFDVASVDRPKSGTGVSVGHLSVLVTQRTAEPSPDYSFPGNPPAQGWAQQFDVTAIIRKSEGSTVEDDETLSTFLADCIKAIAAAATWYNFGGLAVNTEFLAPEPFVSEVAHHIGRTQPVIIYYRTNETDPYTVR